MATTPMSVPVPPRQNRSRWPIVLAVLAALLFGIVIGIFLLVGLVVVGISSAGSLSIVSSSEEPTVRDHSVLVLDFPRGVREEQYSTASLFGSTKPASLLDVITAIRYAAADSKVDGIVVRRTSGMGLAQSREIRNELVAFKRSGKWIYAFLDGGAESDYYLASVADSIFVAPLATIEFNGLGGAVPFFKNLSDKLGITWTVVQREEYKSAAEQFSRTSFSPPAKEEIREILQQAYRVFVSDVASARRMTQTQVERLLDQGVYQAEDFLQTGLVDAIATEAQFTDRVRKRTLGNDSTAKVRTVRPSSYATYARRQTRSSVDENKAIAIIAAEGMIRSGKRSGTATEIASASICEDIRKAADDTTIKAIILRINSGGGSAQASEEIWTELQRARAKKPVYASMGAVAASGGYYIAAGCDTVIASPETITGSIGVIAALPNFSKLFGSIGVTFDTVTTNRNALFMNGVLPTTSAERQTLDRLIDTIYMRFLQRVAASRKRSVNEIRPVARGRVWTGQAAAQHGLVDVIGGLADAIELAKRRIGVESSKRPLIKFFPEQEDLATLIVRAIRNFTGDSDDDAEAALALAGVPHWKATLARLAGQTASDEIGQTLTVAQLTRHEPILMLMPYRFTP